MKNETLAQVFSCEFCETFKNTSFTDHLQPTASEIWKAPILPNLKMAASVFISDKVDSRTNVPVRCVNNNIILTGSFHAECLNFLPGKWSY